MTDKPKDLPTWVKVAFVLIVAGAIAGFGGLIYGAITNPDGHLNVR